MLSRILKSALTTILVFVFGIVTLKAQLFDYQKYPTLSIDITSLNLDLDVNPEEHSLVGSANYKLKSKISGLDSLVLHAAHMQIENVSVNEEPVEFRLHNDSLFIPLTDSSAAGESFDVVIDYSASPKFGIHINENGTLWTSLLPKSTRHWLPTIDHPRVTFVSTMNITVPSGYQVVANGSKAGEEIRDVNSVSYTFKTENEVPSSALSFAVGRFNEMGTSYGIKNISLNTEKDLLTEDEQQRLLEQSYQILKQTEQYLGMEFPFEQLNVTVLKDHNWEPTSWGAGTLFLYKNQGSLEAQLRRGIYAQWFGVHHRPEQWSEAGFYPLIYSALHFQLTDKSMPLQTTDMPTASFETTYDNFGVGAWNLWQQKFKENIDLNWWQTVLKSLTSIARWEGGVYSSTDYATYWYEQNGQPRFDLPSFQEKDSSATQLDSIVYRVDYNLNEQEGKLKLTFNAKYGTVNELVTLPLIAVSANSRDTSEVTFTGAKDSVVVNIPILSETVFIDASQKPKLSLDEYKPANFLIYEVRNGTTVPERVNAAQKLGAYTGNPDLQLAITDLLNQEQEPAVKAALLNSFAQITDGASGTEQVFLDVINSSHDQVRLAALMALQNYPENESVVSSIRSFATGASSLKDFKNAAYVYSSIADTSSFKDFVNTIVQQDTAGFKAVYAIQELANMGVENQSISLAEYYLSDVYDYSIRASALGILLQHDKATEDWRSRAEELLDDLDPRIRFLAVVGLSNVPGLNVTEMLSEHIHDEYDARVHVAIQRVVTN